MVNLTKNDFIELQLQLEKNDPSRRSPSYKAQNVSGIKADFLRKKSSAILELDTASNGNLVPSISVVDDAMDVDADADPKEPDCLDSNDYILTGAAELSMEPAPVFPCTIRYMDLTSLKLKELIRVPLLTLIRDEWKAMIDLFNERKRGTLGSAVFTGSPGIGEHYYRLRTRACMLTS